MTYLTPSRPAAFAPARGTRFSFGFLKFALSVWRQRQSLNQLDAAALLDIGVSRAEAEAEARRPIWDTPAHWKQ